MKCNSNLRALSRCCTDFVLMEEMKAKVWLSIRRDKWGFLADGMLEQMYNNLPLIVWDSKYENVEFVSKDNWGDWLSDLEGKPYYSHYMPIELPKEGSEDERR